MRKSRFFAFLCAFCPGAAQMYLGYMRRGISLMAMFWGGMGLIAFFRLDFLSFLLPVVWFYSFFDGLNLRSMPYDPQVAASRDDYLFHISDFPRRRKDFSDRKYRIAGIGCIALGGYMLYRTTIHDLLWDIISRFPFFGSFFRAVPSIFLALAIILLGIWLIRQEKLRLPDRHHAGDEDWKNYGEDHYHES